MLAIPAGPGERAVPPRSVHHLDTAESWRLRGSGAFGFLGAEVLAFGDSMVEFGVLPGVIAERSGLRAINLAVHDGSPAVSYFLLRRALEAGARPRAIVVDFMPHQLARSQRAEGFALRPGRPWPLCPRRGTWPG